MVSSNDNQGPFALVDQAGSDFELDLLTYLVKLIKSTVGDIHQHHLVRVPIKMDSEISTGSHKLCF